MAKVPNGIETLPKIAIAWVGCTNVTDDRQTTDDRRQTDGRWHIANMNLSSRSLKSTRGVQKVRRPTQLTTRYTHHILSLFNIFSCNWNALGPGFLQSSSSAVEELLFLVFQPAICRADNVLVVENFASFHQFFQFRKNRNHLEPGQCTWSVITRQLKHWLPSKMPALN